MDNVNFIVKARDYSLRYGADGSVRGFIAAWRDKLHRERMMRVDVKGLDESPRGQRVEAYVHQGQWVAMCECGGHEFADPADPVFFCWGCTNRANNGYLRPVAFPDDWEEIETLLLERPVLDVRGATDLERAGLAQAAVIVRADGVVYPLVRSWQPGESLDELRKQNEVLIGLNLPDNGTAAVEVDGGMNGV